MSQDRELSMDAPQYLDPSLDEFQVLNPGEYDFTVVNWTKERYSSEKIAECTKVEVTLRLSQNGEEFGEVRDKFYMLESRVKNIVSFFKGVGSLSHDGRVLVDWGTVIGKSGRLTLKIREWQYNGKTMRGNDVAKYHPAIQMTAPQAAPQNDRMPF